MNKGLGLIGTFAAIAVVALLLYYGFSDNPSAPQAIDSTGYIPHKVDSTITANADWIRGETRSCISKPLDATGARELHKPVGYALLGLECGAGDWHRITITFWGSAVQGRKHAAYWNCVRTTDSFTCKQTGAE